MSKRVSEREREREMSHSKPNQSSIEAAFERYVLCFCSTQTEKNSGNKKSFKTKIETKKLEPKKKTASAEMTNFLPSSSLSG